MAKTPEKKPAPAAKSQALRVLPMELRIGDRLVDETGEWEITSSPRTTVGAKAFTCG